MNKNKDELQRQEQYQAAVLDCLADHRDQTGFTRRYWLHTYGCQLNENDGEKIAGQLHDMGFIPADSPRQADLIVLNTCSVRENAVDRLFGHLGQFKHLRQERPDLLIALCGCMMKQDETLDKIARSYAFVDIVFGPQDIHRLPELLYNRMTSDKKQYYVGQEDSLVEGLPIHRARRFRALTSIMFGCNNFCTYCIVPYTRGRERSRRPQDILDEVGQLVQTGYREIMLLGQNVNSYGQDQAGLADEDGLDFAGLLEACARIPDLYRIRFMTSHPKDTSMRMLEVMARYPNIERHLHLPLQSGSDRILKAMNRRYSRDQYLDIVRSARSLMPDLALSTDMIVGFPGESEDDFEQTLDLMRQVRFDSAFTFLYSPRPGTPAAKLKERIDDKTLQARFDRLVTLQNSHALAANQQRLGQEVEILVEGASRKEAHVFSGRNSQNQLVNFSIPDPSCLPAGRREADGSLSGERLEGGLARVLVDEAQTFSLKGTLTEWMDG